MGFRGERKRILTPSLSQGEGELVTGKIKERGWEGVFYWNFTKKSYRLSVSERLSFLRIR